METGKFPDVKEVPVSWEYEGKYNQAEGFKALVNPSTGQVFSIVSKSYRLIRHEEAASQLKKVVDKNPALGRHEIETEFYDDGARMRRTYRFIDKKEVISGKDFVNPELHLFNSYDVSWAFSVLLGAFSEVCGNGLVVGKKFLHLKKRHIYSLRTINLEDEVGSALQRFENQAIQWRLWSETDLTEKAYNDLTIAMRFGNKALEIINNRIKSETQQESENGVPAMTLWEFYNVITWYITHEAISLNHKVDMEARLRTAMQNF